MVLICGIELGPVVVAREPVQTPVVHLPFAFEKIKVAVRCRRAVITNSPFASNVSFGIGKKIGRQDVSLCRCVFNVTNVKYVSR